MFMARLKNNAHFYRFGSGLIRILSSSTIEKCPSQSVLGFEDIQDIYFAILVGFFRDNRNRIIPEVGQRLSFTASSPKSSVIGQENYVFLNTHTS